MSHEWKYQFTYRFNVVINLNKDYESCQISLFNEAYYTFSYVSSYTLNNWLKLNQIFWDFLSFKITSSFTRSQSEPSTVLLLKKKINSSLKINKKKVIN